MSFVVRSGVMHADAVSLETMAAEIGTPTYVYSASAIRARYRAFRDAFAGLPAMFCYALKANSNLAVIRTLAAEGAGADTVSAGEIERALAAGVPPAKIVYAGVAKTDDEIRFALSRDILQFNVESVAELRRLSELAIESGRQASVALRINPDVEAATLDKISTGRKQDKFGIPFDEAAAVYAMAQDLSGVRPEGLHIHIGSQISTLEPFAKAYAKAAGLYRDLQARSIPLKRLDLGGGFGVRYGDEEPLAAAPLADLVRDSVRDLDCTLIFEPGRAFVAEAGVLLTSVLYVKANGERRFLIVDAGMNTLLRPALYGAHHEIAAVRPGTGADREPYDVVGPICESTDVFGRARALPALGRGDLVVLKGAGAYGAVMASDYNSRARPAEVLVDGDRFAVIKPRVEAREQFHNEVIPTWLDAAST